MLLSMFDYRHTEMLEEISELSTCAARWTCQSISIRVGLNKNNSDNESAKAAVLVVASSFNHV